MKGSVAAQGDGAARGNGRSIDSHGGKLRRQAEIARPKSQGPVRVSACLCQIPTLAYPPKPCLAFRPPPRQSRKSAGIAPIDVYLSENRHALRG